MYFKSMEIRNFRQFRELLQLHSLVPGLNVIAGANEAGKSTLLQALRAVLFDRYRSTTAKRYRPYGTKASPEVQLTFDLNDTEYTIHKVFSARQNGLAELNSDHLQLQGEEAEERLAEILGCSLPGRALKNPKPLGLAALLWVEQARAWQEPALDDDNRRLLHQAFDTEVGELLDGGQGTALLSRITELRGEYLSRHKKLPRGGYKQLLEAEQQQARTLKQAHQDLQEYQGQTEELGKKQAELRRRLETREEEQLEQKLRQARQQLQQIETLQKQVATGQQQLSQKQAEHKLAQERMETRGRHKQELEEAGQAIKKAKAKVDRRKQELHPAERALQESKRQRQALQKAKEEAEQRLRAAAAKREREEQTREQQRLQGTLRQVQAAEQQQRESIAQRDTLPVTRETMEALRNAEQRALRSWERLQAAATRIEYRLLPNAKARLNDTELQKEGDLQITELAVLELENTGTLTITPGGGELETRRHQAQARKRELQALLQKAGVQDLAGAEQTLNRREHLDREAARHKERAQALAPQGTPKLEQQLASVKARLAPLLQADPAATDQPPTEPQTEPPTEPMEQQIREYNTRLSELEIDLEARGKALQKQRDRLAKARAEQTMQQERAGRAETILRQARETTSDDALSDACSHARLDLETAKQAQAEYSADLEAEHPRQAASELERFETSLRQAQERTRTLEQDTRDLQVALRALGQRGLAEEQTLAQEKHEAVKRELDYTRNRVEALDLLHRTLENALRETKERIAKPVADRMLPYLRQLIPEAAPSINEELLLTGIRRNAAEPFRDLSIGTREQLAVLLRLAYADLLSAKAQPVTVILDDALVNSDQDRRERMKRILHQAAEHYQILLLTCHEQAYRDSGGQLIRLAECHAQS